MSIATIASELNTTVMTVAMTFLSARPASAKAKSDTRRVV